jgi:hypothetical protein
LIRAKLTLSGRARRLILVPTYLVYLGISRFHRRHVWYRTCFTYNDWCRGATPLCVQIGLVMTLMLWNMPIAASALIRYFFFDPTNTAWIAPLVVWTSGFGALLLRLLLFRR